MRQTLRIWSKDFDLLSAKAVRKALWMDAWGDSEAALLPPMAALSEPPVTKRF